MKTNGSLKAQIVEWLLFFGIVYAIDALWTIFEYMEFGQKMPSASDTIIAFIMAASIYLNIRTMNDDES